MFQHPKYLPLGNLFKASLLLMLVAAPVLVPAQTHPRLLFGPEEVPALREKITRSPYDIMFQLLMEDAETGQYRSYDGPTPEFPDRPTDPYGECINAMRLGFLYVLTGDDYYANRARFYVERRIYDNTVHRWAYSGQKGLNLYFNGKSVAMTYDWCYGAPSWDAAFCEEVSAKLLAQGNVIADSGGTEQNKNSASNWQGLRGSSALLCFLAGDETYSSSRFTSMFNKTQDYLQDNLGTDPLSRGWNIEGIGYLGYPYAAVIPAVIATLRDNPDNNIVSGLAAMDYALWTQYAATVRFLRGEDVWLVHPDFGDDNATADDANGAYGFAFAFSHPDLVPGLLYWYRRLLTPEPNWDYTRGGTIFSILYYPEGVQETPPLEIEAWREGFVDVGGNGFFTYRNQYEDETDLVAQMYLKLRGNKGHNGPDALSFRILGLNTAWAVGGGRYGIKTNGQDVFLRSQNTLYPVDPDSRLSINGNSGSVVGTPLVYEEGDGHVVSRISRNNVGTVNQKRWFASDYSGDAGVDAVYIVADTSDDGFFWQYNTLEENTIEAAADGFLVRGMDGATLKGTFLYPGGEHIATTGTRIRGSKFCYGRYGEYNHFYHLQGNGDYLAVFTVARDGQVHPAVNLVKGRVAPAIIQVGARQYALTEDAVVRDPAPLNLPDPPAAATGLTATPSSNFPEVLLAWDSIDGADGYIVERAEGTGPFEAVAKLKASGSSTVDNDLQTGIAYRYRVKAYNAGGDGACSPVAMVRIPDLSSAAYLAVESFEQYPDGQIGGNNGPGGWSGPWSYGDSAVVDVSAEPLSANGLSGGDKALDLGWGDIIGTRLFAGTIPSSAYGDGIWLTYLLKWESGEIGSDDRAWIFNTIGNRDWAFAGLNSDGGFRVSDWYASGTTSGTVMSPGETVQVVVRVTYSQIELWINPASADEPPLVSHSNDNSKGWQGGWPGIGLSSRSNTDNFLIDRIMVTRSFEALMQEPPERPPFALWQDSFDWPDAASAEKDADPDKDGLPNHVEFVHGSHPLEAGPQPVALHRSDGGGMLCRVALRSAAAMEEFSLQSSVDLATGWTDIDPATVTYEYAEGTTWALVPLLSNGENSSQFVRAIYP